MSPVTIILIIAIVLITTAIIWWLKSRESSNCDLLYSDALNAILKGDNTEAVKLLKQVVSKDSDNIGAYLQLGNIVRSVNPRQSAKIHQSLTVRPKLSKQVSKDIHQALAIDYIEVEDYKRAKIEAEMVLKYDKKNIWANKFLLNIAEKQNNWETANELLLKVQKNTGKKDVRQLADIQYRAGLNASDDGDNKKALQHFNKSIKVDPTFSLSYLQIGNILKEENNLKKALDSWEKYLLNTDTTDLETYKKIESALFDLGRFSEIEQLYQRVHSQKPKDKNTLVKIANLLYDKDDTNDALQIIENVINKNENSISARLLKLKILVEKANPIDLKEQIDDIIKRIDS